MLKMRLLWVVEWDWDFLHREGELEACYLTKLLQIGNLGWGGWTCWAFADLFPPRPFLVFQDDHKLSLDELHRKYGTDLSRVGRLCFPSFLALIWKGSVLAQSTSRREIRVVWFFSPLFCLISPPPVKLPRLRENCRAHKYFLSSSHCTAWLQYFSDFVSNKVTVICLWIVPRSSWFLDLFFPKELVIKANVCYTADVV